MRIEASECPLRFHPRGDDGPVYIQGQPTQPGAADGLCHQVIVDSQQPVDVLNAESS